MIDKLCLSHPVNSVGAPINGTLGNRSLEVIIEGLGDLINKDSIILDLGSGDGKTALKFAASLGATAVGIEYDKLRFQSSMVNLVACMKTTDVKATFIHGDIDMYFKTFNGYDIIYMFDTAFTTNTINKIKCSFNNSSTVKAIVSNNLLEKIGYDVTLFRSLGSLSAQNINRNFYIYKANKYSNNLDVTNDEINVIDIQKAKIVEQRSNEAISVKESFLNQSRDILSFDQNSSRELFGKLQLSSVTINGILFTKTNQVVGVTDRRSCYVLFNRQDLEIANRYEYRAILLTTKYLGILTPAYDNGEILISIIHYTHGPVYEAIIYNIRSQSFRSISAKQLFESNLRFNYTNVFPIDTDMVSIMSAYRVRYPIAKVSTAQKFEDNTQAIQSKRKAAALVSNKTFDNLSVSVSDSYSEIKSKRVKEDNITKLQEENRILKRKHEELQKELTKKSRTTSADKVTAELLLRESKDSERIIKEKENEIKRLQKEREREINELKVNQERDIKSLERQLKYDDHDRDLIRKKFLYESCQSDMNKLIDANEKIILELKKEREVRDIERKEYQSVTTKLYERLIDAHEDKYQDNRADTKVYFDKMLDFAKYYKN